MIEVIIHLWSIELVIPKTIKPEARRLIYRPINQLKEQTTNKIVQTSYKRTALVCVSKYRFEKDKTALLELIEQTLIDLKICYRIINKAEGKPEVSRIKQFHPISGEAYVKYSQGSTNKIVTITITLKDAPINLGLKSKIANEFLTGLWGLPGAAWLQKNKPLQKVIRLTVPLSNPWEVLEKLAEERISIIKNEIKAANIEYSESVDPAPKPKSYIL